MAQCSDCYNGCVQITSDKCVQYTGVDVPLLDIKKGDSLSYVEQALITFLTSVVNGSGIKITIDEGMYCTLVSQYLQECSEVTALDLFKALVQAACDLQEQITTEKARIDAIEANYTVDCLTGVSAGDGTHDILQAVITKLCEVDDTLTALALDLDTNYVKLSDLDSLIAAYIASTETANKAYTKMVPYTVVEYYGSLSNYPAAGDSFDVSGAGQNYWEKVYLCNGNNGTPDKRGRSPIGAIVGMGGGALDSEVDPGVSPFNQNYEISGANAKNGANSVILTEAQMPSHTHDITDPGHTHEIDVTTADSDAPNGVANYPQFNSTATAGPVTATDPIGLPGAQSNLTGITVTESKGSGDAHSNVHPVLACYYIMYIP